MRFLKKLLICLYAFLAVFAVTCLILWAVRGEEPDALIMAVFGAAGIESVVGALMKIKEKKTNETEGGEQPPRRAE